MQPHGSRLFPAPPPDFELDAFDITSDGSLVFLSWASGRLEVQEMQTGKRISESKPMRGGVLDVATSDAMKEWVYVGPHGLLRFVDPQSGKTVREIHTEIGRFKYDIQKVIIAPDVSWLAYINGENGKVLDLRSNPPKVLADLANAEDLMLSPDKSQIWAINREKLFGISVAQWSPVGTAALLDHVRPEDEPTLAVVNDKESPVAFAPSVSGLLRYDLKTMKGTKITHNPAFWVYSAVAQGQVLVTELDASSLYAPDGSVQCQWQPQYRRRTTISENGEWLGSLNFPKVEVWSLKKLLASCPRQP